MENEIIRALPANELELIVPHLRDVELRKGTVLYDAGLTLNHVYFPKGAMVSYLSGTSEGQTIEVGVVGREGLVGGTAMLLDAAAFRAVVQIDGAAFRVAADLLRRELHRCSTLQRLVLGYSSVLLVQVAQTAVCNKFHSVEQRFCRWLMLAHDRCRSTRLEMTQDALARILGTRRASITVAAGLMQRAGAIRYSRGVITITDRRGLERAACECYETIANAYHGMARRAKM